MKRFFAERPMVAFFIVAVAATVVSAWIINPKEGPLRWLIHAGGSVDQLTLKVLAAAAILCVGASMTYIAWRLAKGAQAAYAGGTSIPNLRMLRVPDHQPERSPQSAIDELDAMIGLAPVKDEVNKLIARLQVEQKRREQGLPVINRAPGGRRFPRLSRPSRPSPLLSSLGLSPLPSEVSSTGLIHRPCAPTSAATNRRS